MEVEAGEAIALAWETSGEETFAFPRLITSFRTDRLNNG
jgi:hypothetical protein